MRQELDQLGFKGSFFVMKNGKTWLDYATANLTDTSYLINSVQKSMTAAMIMKEVQDHKLSLNDSLAKFYPTIPSAKKIKIKHLLTMKSGLSLEEGESLGAEHFVSDKDNIEQDLHKTVFTKAKFGEWNYDSINYVYLCGILTQLEHKSYEELFNETFVEPLQLENTTFLWASQAELFQNNWVPGYSYKNGHFVISSYKAAVKEAHNELGAGSVIMSNYDIVKVMQYMLGGEMLTAKSRKLLYKGVAPSYYNGGLYNNPDFKMANGAGSGYYTFLRMNKDAKTMILIQSNQVDDANFVPIKVKISRIMTKLMAD